MRIGDILDAKIKHQTRTGLSPTLIGLHPTDHDHISITAELFCALDPGAIPYGALDYLAGMRVVPCPDTEEGIVEVLG